MRNRTLVGLLVLPVVALPMTCRAADLTLLQLKREVQAKAVWYDTIGNNNQPDDSGSTTGPGIWNDTRAADSGFNSRATASIVSNITSTAMYATANAHAQAPTTSLLQTAYAMGRVLFKARFSVSTSTLVQYYAAIPVVSPRFITPPTTYQDLVLTFKNTSTNTILSTVQGGWGHPNPVPAASTSFLLAPGEYEIEGIMRLQGGASHALLAYSDTAKWVVSLDTCYANCDASFASPTLTANDFQCFLDRFAVGSVYANCDASTGTPVLTANDFQCYINQFVAGCP